MSDREPMSSIDTAWLRMERPANLMMVSAVLTFETKFFNKHGFVEIEGTPVSPEVYEEIMRSVDEGVAEFLDLSYVKPNTLGNSRMLLEL